MCEAVGFDDLVASSQKQSAKQLTKVPPLGLRVKRRVVVEDAVPAAASPGRSPVREPGKACQEQEQSQDCNLHDLTSIICRSRRVS